MTMLAKEFLPLIGGRAKAVLAGKGVGKMFADKSKRNKQIFRKSKMQKISRKRNRRK